MFGKIKQTKALWTGTGVLVFSILFSMVLSCTLEPKIDDLREEVINANPYTVTFMANDTVYTTKAIVKGHTVPKPDNPTGSSSETFGWWFTEDPAGKAIADLVPWDFANDKITGNTTLYASFNDDSSGDPVYSVVFFVYGDNGTRTFKVVETTGSPAKIASLPTMPSKLGYTVDKWNTKPDGSGTINLVSSTEVTESIAVYAQWRPVVYEVEYDPNDGTVPTMTNSIHTYNVDKALTTNEYTAPAGEYFLGWSTEDGVSPVIYNDGQTVKNLSTTEGDIVTLYAQWGQIITYTAKADGASKDTDSTEITFTFTPALPDTLKQSEISINKDTGDTGKVTVEADSLTGSGVTWTIQLSKVITQGDITVEITHSGAGYKVDDTAHTVPVYKEFVKIDDINSDSALTLIGGDGIITGLVPGEYYKVFDGSTTHYVKTGTTSGDILSTNLYDIGKAASDTIIGLDNSKTYQVNAATKFDSPLLYFDHTGAGSMPPNVLPATTLTADANGKITFSTAAAVQYGLDLSLTVSGGYEIMKLNISGGSSYSSSGCSGVYDHDLDLEGNPVPFSADIPGKTAADVRIYQYNTDGVPGWLDGMSILYMDKNTSAIVNDYIISGLDGSFKFLEVAIPAP